MENLINIISNALNGHISKEIIVFIISLFPILELRGGLLAGSLLKVPYTNALIASVIGNILPIPFILVLLEHILKLMEKWNFTKKFAIWLRKKAEKNKPAIDKYGFFGLVLFVGIPLPGTGAWTGSLVASVFHMDKKKSFLAILLGIILALIIMSIISYGIIGKIIK